MQIQSACGKMFIHFYIHMYIHTYIHTYMHTCTHAYMRTGIFVALKVATVGHGTTAATPGHRARGRAEQHQGAFNSAY